MGTITRTTANNLTTGLGLNEGDFKLISNTTISSDVSDVSIEPSNFTDFKVYCIIINRLQFGSDNIASLKVILGNLLNKSFLFVNSLKVLTNNFSTTSKTSSCSTNDISKSN